LAHILIDEPVATPDQVRAGFRRNMRVYLAHILYRRTGTHPGSSPGQAFAGICAKGAQKL